MARFLRTETNSSGGHSRLRPPPRIIGAGIAFHGPGVRLADPLSPNSVRLARRAKSRLGPPVVVLPAVANTGPSVMLAPSSRIGRSAHSVLRPPRVVTPDTFTPCAVVTDTFVRADEDPVANIWGESVAVGPTKTGRVLSNQFVPKAAQTQGFAYLFQPVNVTGPFQVSMKFSYTTNVGTAILGVGDSATGIGRARITVGKNDVQLFLFAVRVVTATRPIASGDSLALVVTPGSPNSTYDVFHKPGAGSWQKIISYVGSEITWASESVIRPFIVANDTGAINDFSFCPYTNDGVTAMRATQSRGAPSSRLAPPVVVTRAATFVGPLVHLARSLRGTPTSFLRAPVVVEGAVTYGGPGVKLAAPRDRNPRVVALLHPPSGIVAPALARPPLVHLAPSRRGTPRSFLRWAIVVNAYVADGVVDVTLTYSLRGKPKSRLSLTTVVAPVLARPISTSFATIRPAAVHSVLRRPTDLVDRDDVGSLRSHLSYSRRGTPKSRLKPPTVVAPVLARAIVTKLVRIRPPHVVAALRLPVAIDLSPQVFRGKVELAYSLRGKPKSQLRPPAVVTQIEAPVTPFAVALARITPPKTHSFLRAPVVVAQETPVTTLTVAFARITPQRTHSFLRWAIVVNAYVADAVADVTLAYSLRGKPKSILRPPAVVAPVLARSPVVRLVRIAPAPVHSILRRPTDLVDQQDLGFVRVSLAYSLRGKPKSRLSLPTVVAPVLARPVSTRLVRIAPPPIHSILRKPTDLVDQQDVGSLEAHLAYSRRGRPKSRLALPTVVAPVLARPTDVTLVRIRPVATRALLRRPVDLVDREDVGSVRVRLAYSLRGKAKPRLTPPTVVVAPSAARPIVVHLAYSRRGKPLSGLGRPVVLDSNTAYPQGPMVQLTYSSRGKPKSRLAPPVVAAAATPVLRRLSVTLVRIRPVPVDASVFKPVVVELPSQLGGIGVSLAPSFRGKPKSSLAPPTVAAPVLAAPVVVVLTYSLRGKPKSKLSPPTVVEAFRIPVVTVALAPSSRGVPKSVLRRPTDLVDQQDLGSASVTLAYSLRGKPKSHLEPPTAVNPFRIPTILTWLAASFRGRPIWVLSLPVDLVDEQDKGSVRTHLAYSLRGKPKSRLIPPLVVGPILARPALVYLAPSFRGIPKSRLSAPTVVSPFFVRPTDITLARITPPPVHSVLRKPTDLVDRQDVGSLRVDLAYSLRGKSKSRLTPPIVIDLRPQVYYPVVNLAYSRRGVPKSKLPQASLFTPEAKAEYTLAINLAYQSRGKPKSKLSPPTVVTAATPYLRAIDTTLVRILPPGTIWRIGRPTDTVELEDQGSVAVTLAYSRRGKAKSKLFGVVYAARVHAPIRLDLAPQRRGVPKSKLPQVIYAARVYAPIAATLAPQRRGAPKSFLHPPTDLVDARDLGAVLVHVAQIRPPRTYPFLRAPAVVNASLAEGVVNVTLARIRPTIVNSVLREPTIIGRDSFRGLLVGLAPSSRGVARSFQVKPPISIVTLVARPVSVHLTYSRRGKPLSVLSRPVVLDANTAYPQGPMVRLAPQRRGAPKSLLGRLVVSIQPTAVETVISTTLAYSVRGKPKSRLSIANLYPGTTGIVCSEVLDLVEVCGDTTDLSGILQGAVLDENVASGDDIEESTAAGENLDIYHVDGEVL